MVFKKPLRKVRKSMSTKITVDGDVRPTIHSALGTVIGVAILGAFSIAGSIWLRIYHSGSVSVPKWAIVILGIIGLSLIAISILLFLLRIKKSQLNRTNKKKSQLLSGQPIRQPVMPELTSKVGGQVKAEKKDNGHCRQDAITPTVPNISTVASSSSPQACRMRLKPWGYHLIGAGAEDGIRILWCKNGDASPSIESLSLNRRVRMAPKPDDEKISAYTTSVSCGCVLKPMGLACKFCRTGQALQFTGMLSEYEIALQNIFMVLTDRDCESFPHTRTNKREFAYMGQGEPGFSYPQIRKAIKITDEAMSRLNQTVHRHLISTAGVPSMIEQLIDDIQRGYYANRVTLHFSLHATIEREKIMPIDNLYSFESVLPLLSRFYDVTGEKPCVAIMAFNSFKPPVARKAPLEEITTDEARIREMLRVLDPNKHRISICQHNDINIGPFATHVYERFVQGIQRNGFDVKFFASFGSNEHAACGMLENHTPLNPGKPGQHFKMHYAEAIGIISDIDRKGAV